MVPPPPRSGNWEGFAPRRPEACVSRDPSQKFQNQQISQTKSGNGSVLMRKETESGIPGLTYDHAGRPV